MPGLLYPAYQKFYSALRNLERFDKEADFFDNVSCLDGFFSEYRNVTFVIQSQLKHTKHFVLYERARDAYLKDHWFVEKRNETIKQIPFQLVKSITLTMYSPSDEIVVSEREFTVDDDVPLDSLKDQIAAAFSLSPFPEVFFSATYSFHELGSDVDLLKKLLDGISSMRDFLEEMDRGVGEECERCEELKARSENLIQILRLPRDFLLTDDYVFYKPDGRFEKADRLTLLGPNGGKFVRHRPLSDLTKANHFNFNGTAFGTFSLMHALMRAIRPGMDIMPAILIVYDDETYDLDAFHASIKTTMYRKLNEAAKTVMQGGVSEVCYESLYIVLDTTQNIPAYHSERMTASSSDVLVVASVDKQLSEKEYVFDGTKLECPEYVAAMMRDDLQRQLHVSRCNLSPVLRAFATVADNRKVSDCRHIH